MLITILWFPWRGWKRLIPEAPPTLHYKFFCFLFEGKDFCFWKQNKCLCRNDFQSMKDLISVKDCFWFLTCEKCILWQGLECPILLLSVKFSLREILGEFLLSCCVIFAEISCLWQFVDLEEVQARSSLSYIKNENTCLELALPPSLGSYLFQVVPRVIFLQYLSPKSPLAISVTRMFAWSTCGCHPDAIQKVKTVGDKDDWQTLLFFFFTF